MKKIILMMITLMTINKNLKSNHEAVVIAPAIDLLGQSMKSFYKTLKKRNLSEMEITAAYDQLTEITKDNEKCPRIHQLLFNERVIIEEEKNNEVKIKVPFARYGIGTEGKLGCTYWTLKKNLATKAQIGDTLFERLVPKSINGQLNQQNTITLIKPFYHKPSGSYFSAGTRFMIHGVNAAKNYTVLYYYPQAKKAALMIIPREICKENPQSQSQAQKEYVNLLKTWAHASSLNTIAYVWGGSSFLPSNNGSLWSGFDCAGLIIRAAQSRSIPFYLKNSSAQKYHLDELNKQSLEEGDIMWIPGHVMIISDLKNNKIIESRGYGSGYGCVHEQPLSKIFKNIKSYDDLLKAYYSKTPLELIDKEGKISNTITDYSLLKFSSIWKNYRTTL